MRSDEVGKKRREGVQKGREGNRGEQGNVVVLFLNFRSLVLGHLLLIPIVFVITLLRE